MTGQSGGGVRGLRANFVRSAWLVGVTPKVGGRSQRGALTAGPSLEALSLTQSLPLLPLQQQHKLRQQAFTTPLCTTALLTSSPFPSALPPYVSSCFPSAGPRPSSVTPSSARSSQQARLGSRADWQSAGNCAQGVQSMLKLVADSPCCLWCVVCRRCSLSRFEPYQNQPPLKQSQNVRPGKVRLLHLSG